MPAPGIGSGLLRVGMVLCLVYAVIAVGAGLLQVVQAGPLSTDPRNPLQLAAERAPRGRIMDARGVVVATDARSAGGARRRRYPHPAMAPITGYKSVVFGAAGLERTYDRQLMGLDQLRPGGELLRKFQSGRSDPNDLVLSVDVRLQELAARSLGDQRGAVVAIEPATGRILALVSTPGFDAARLSDPVSGHAYLASLDQDASAPLLDRATQGRYVPGSVFKLVTAAAGLESGAIGAGTTFDDQPVQSRRGFALDGFRIRDAARTVQLDHPLNLPEAMEVSSNVWFAHAGLATGARALMGFAQRLGFGSAVGFDLPTASSQLNGGDGPLEGFADRVELANAAFGQGEVVATPLQMALVVAAIANGGLLMQPTLVDRLVPHRGNEQRLGPRTLGRVLTNETAETLRDAMVQAVQGRYAEHYAGAAKVAGITTAGKSGTAQLGPGQRPHSWFVGFRARGRAADRHRGRGRERGFRKRASRAPGWSTDDRVAQALRAFTVGTFLLGATSTRVGWTAYHPRDASPLHGPGRRRRGPISIRGRCVSKIQESVERVAANVERVIVGKHAEVRLALVALLCQGHLLIEDVPGTGKTMLAKAIARSLGCSFRRIQFTPDLLPTDVTGLSIYNQKTQEFEFRPGPIVSQIVLADEINRATPKTQSALLECMEERHMTVDGISYQMPDPFLVIATQNPIEYEGTFSLPEAQLDRFMLRIRLGYPAPLQEIVILDEQKRSHPLEQLPVVAEVEELMAMQAGVREIYVDSAISDYIVRLVNATRAHPDVYLGASPRGSLALVSGRSGICGDLRPRLRHSRRRQDPRRAGPGPQADRSDRSYDPRRGTRSHRSGAPGRGPRGWSGPSGWRPWTAARLSMS